MTINSIIMAGIAPKQNVFKFKIAPHKQKSIVKKLLWQEDPQPPGTKGTLCLSTSKHNGKSGTVKRYHNLFMVVRDYFLLDGDVCFVLVQQDEID